MIAGIAPGAAGLTWQAQFRPGGDGHGKVVCMHGGKRHSQGQKSSEEEYWQFPRQQPFHDRL